jgi:transposase
MDDRCWMTVRLVQYIQTQVLRRTVVSIAAEIGLDEKTIPNIFHDYVAALKATRSVSAPMWLGIDELTLAGKPSCILTNSQEGSIFDLLASRTQTVVATYLCALPQANQISDISMDMWQPYKTACQVCLPQVRIIVDKFHVVHMANQALESVHKTLRTSLSDRQRRTLMHDRHVLLRRLERQRPLHPGILARCLPFAGASV